MSVVDTMRRLVHTALIALLALGFGQQAAAQESIQFIDGGDLQLLEPTRPPQPWQSLAKDKAGTATTLKPSAAASKSIMQIQAEPKLDGIRIGADIKLDESDRIELREASRMSFRADIGTMPSFSSSTLQGPFGAASATVMTPRGFDERALFAKAAGVNLNKPLTTAMLRDPQVMMPHYAGLRVGYASGYSADDPLGLDPARRGFEVYLTSAAMSTAPKKPGAPPTTRTWPQSPLWAQGLRLGSPTLNLFQSSRRANGSSLAKMAAGTSSEAQSI